MLWKSKEGDSMRRLVAIFLFVWTLCSIGNFALAEVASQYNYVPPFLTNSLPPMVMLTMARDHRLYYEAYNDASDIDGDGELDIRYKPSINYYGYFDSFKYYEYNNAAGRFEPRGVTTTKKAPDGPYWSGDFLNYVSMTRMDCLRKVLYGGYRSTDTATETVLERAYIPQDAHSFGKEYESIARDGYDIREYTPLDLPLSGRRHLIATTALGTDGAPLLRVLPNSSARIWEWVATERPVVKSNFGGSTSHPGHPANAAEFQNMVATYATPSRQFGNTTGDTITINGSDNPFGNDDNFLTIFSGSLNIDKTGNYTFAIDGDDAVELLIDGNVVVGWYGGHGKCDCKTHNATVALTSGQHTIEFRHEEASGSANYYLYWYNVKKNKWYIVPASSTLGLSNMTHATYNLVDTAVITDYILRVQVGVASMPEPNCKLYPNGTYKPIGILQRHGESDKMLFGLITGSYTKNLSGGVLRQNIGSISREINSTTGEFLYLDNSSIGGIIATIDRLRIHGFRNDSNFDYNENCGWIATRPLREGECRMWGNPMAEMMYETVRYFAGAGNATPAFTYSSTDVNLDDNQLGLPLAAWNNPYNASNYCAKPVMIAISDIFPSYDSDQLPGSAWNSTFTSTLSGLNVQTRSQNISDTESINGTYFIGESSSYNGACTPKSVLGFGSIRGLCPEEPTKQGSFYSAAVTNYGATTDLNTVNGTQSMISYIVALSSPLPEIKISVGNSTITMVPFAKSVGGSGISAAQGSFQPTNTIVDFFVEEINATSGKFRVNFEDVEQGADHDMDAIVRYSYEVLANNTVQITLTSEYAAGGIIQHMGYIISGTTTDGTYLVVRDKDTAEGSDPDYYLDFPNEPGPLPLTSTLFFTPGSTPGASLLKTPLWYAAKWGGFEDSNNNGIPDLTSDWDKNNDGVPDTYFYVANPTKLEEQLNKAFADILRRTASGSAASVISQSREGEGAVYQSIFFPEFRDEAGNTIHWAGQVHALLVDPQGNIREDTNGNGQLDIQYDKIIRYQDLNIYRYTDVNANGKLDPEEQNATIELLNNPFDVHYIWTSSAWLNQIDNSAIVAQRSFYNATTANRYIITFADKNANGVVETGEIQHFKWPPDTSYSPGLTNSTDFYAYLTLYPSFEDTPAAYNTLRTSNSSAFAALLEGLARRQVDFIRGADQSSETIAGIAVNASRSRHYVENGTSYTWRLGDVVFSTPTVVGKPAENYHLIYKDETYQDFVEKYKNRRNVVYVGANDGMLHAFNAGFYNSTRKGFDTTQDGKTQFPIGSELWAYIPYNLLPHLYWLMDPSYGRQLHVSYMDLKPRVFDARVFFQTDGITPNDNATHPQGWGTLLVAGMRFGGGKIRADLDKTGLPGFDNATDRIMGSAYVIFDITDPELGPQPLAEIRLPGMGFTTCYPTVMPMSTPNANTASDNNWYLVFGSGPANSAGEPDPNTINLATSDQAGKLFVLDLKALTTQKTIRTLDATGSFLSNSTSFFAETEPGSFIGDPVAVDLDVGKNDANQEFKADVVYYGSIAGDPTNATGKMYRLITNDTQESSNIVTWIGNSTLINVQKPFSASASIALDEKQNIWVYAGTGRFFTRNDIQQSQGMSFYGIKEPKSNGTETWSAVNAADLFNSTQISLVNATCGNTFTKTCVQVIKTEGSTNTTLTWDSLISQTESKPGWERNFPSQPLERVLGQAAVLGGTTLFTTYIPSDDLCEIEGRSKLYAVYYKTGTPYYIPILTNTEDPFAVSVELGKGLALTPNIHVGEKSKGTAFIQTSTGAIATVELAMPLPFKSGILYWLKRTTD
jgi:type IV pilus assembly protein PilY1